jgi:hypothetical protein
MARTPEGCHRFSDTRVRVWSYFRLLSGGLRYAATTGYYLTALQADSTCDKAPDPRVRIGCV